MRSDRLDRTDEVPATARGPVTPRPLVDCEAASRTFGTGTHAVVAVHSATCEVWQGDRMAVMGASGSGKSTLMHLLAGLDQPSSGTVSWPGLGVTADELGGSVAMVFQGASLMPPLTALENVAMPRLLAGVSDSQARVSAAAALDSLDIGALADRLPEELSGGQAQRVCVARAIAGGPRLILADEPTGQLDSVAANHVVDVLIHAADLIDAGLVVATHDPRVATRLMTRWSMRDGILTPQQTPARRPSGRSRP